MALIYDAVKAVSCGENSDRIGLDKGHESA